MNIYVFKMDPCVNQMIAWSYELSEHAAQFDHANLNYAK
jgi:hypothetical protein